MNKGVIYVLTNPSFPEYVKIGYADDLEKRLNQLNRSECLPFAFRVYCTYEVEDRLKDKDVHRLIDRLNPELRAVETFNGKSRVREFYNMSAEDAYDILNSIASISGTIDRLKRIEPDESEKEDELVAKDFQDNGQVQYTEEDHLLKSSTGSKTIYTALKNKILELDGMELEPKKLYIAFRLSKNSKNVCALEIQRSKIKAIINMPKGKLNDPNELTEDVSNKGHWATGDYIVQVTDVDMIDNTMELILQSYKEKI